MIVVILFLGIIMEKYKIIENDNKDSYIRGRIIVNKRKNLRGN